MKSAKRKFTFEDWKAKRIPLPQGAGSWNENSLMRKSEYDRYTLNHWNNRGLLTDSEYQKIKDEKRKAYYKALKINVQIEFDVFIEDCRHTSPEDMSDVIRMEMELTEKKLTNHRVLQAIKQGKDASRLINPGLYNEIKNGNYIIIPFPFFEAHQSYEYLEKLKSTYKKCQETENTGLSEDDIYKQILDTPEGIWAGKIAFFQRIERHGTFRNMEKAYEEADKIHRELQGKHLYKNFGTFESAHSQFFIKKPEAQTILKKILKPFE